MLLRGDPLDNLRTAHAKSETEPITGETRHGEGAHRRHRRSTRADLHDPRPELDPLHTAGVFSPGCSESNKCCNLFRRRRSHARVGATINVSIPRLR